MKKQDLWKKDRNIMKVTYEFNCEIENDDRYDFKVFQRAHKMYDALNEISCYMRQLRKGYVEDTADQIEEKVSEIVYESSIGEIE